MINLTVDFANDLGVEPAEVQSFYLSNWNRKIALSDDKFYRWQFVDNPPNIGADECVVARIDGEVVGVMGVGSRPFWLNGRECRGAELTTWVVSERFRGKGIGPAIIQFLQKKYEILLGAGITLDALPVYLRSGFHFLKFLPRHLRIYDLPAIEKYSHVEPLGRKLVKQRIKLCLDNTCLYQEIKIDASVIDSIHKSFSVKYNLFERNFRALDWRYISHPVFNYKLSCLANASGEKILIVTKTDDLPNGAKILRVIDMIGSAEMYAAAADYIDRLCESQDLAAADFFCTVPYINSVLKARGWFSILDESFVQFPHLFSPVELRTPPTTSLIYWARNEIESLLDLSKFYVTKGDVDLDRPTPDDIGSLCIKKLAS